MMAVHLYKLKFNAFICTFTLVLNACSSTEQLDSLSGQEQADKKQAIETVIEEWQESKPSIKRLVAMEGDLNTLIDELSVLSSIADQVDEPITNKVEPLSTKGNDKVTLTSNSNSNPNSNSNSNSISMANKGKVDEKPDLPETSMTNMIHNKQQNPKVGRESDNSLVNATSNVPNKDIKTVSVGESPERHEFKEPETKQNEKINKLFSSAIHLATFTTLQQSKQAWLRLNGRFSHHFKGKKPMVNNLNKDGIKLYRLQVGPYSIANAEQLCGRLNEQNQHCMVVENEGRHL